MGIDDAKKEIELVNAMKKGICEAVGIVREVGKGLMGCAHLLRVEQTERVFTALSEGIKDLSHLIDFIKELKSGMEHLKGSNVSMEPLLCWDRSLNVFEEMLSAFERKDWITLSDLIQYELHPLLIEGEKGLSDLKERFQEA